MSACVWKVDDNGKLRKKGKGEAEMVSAFTDSVKGFGLKMTEAELQQVNVFREAQGRLPLTESPGLRFLRYGNVQRGTTVSSTVQYTSWNNEKMLQQTIDYMDAAEVLYPNHQLHFQFDWSSGHAKRSDNGLSAMDVNLNYGGKQRRMRDSLLTADCIGPHPTVANGVDYAVRASQTQTMCFGVSTAELIVPPPFNKPNAPRQDVLNDDGSVKTEGFEGKPKGAAQILFESGWWHPSGKMVGSMPRVCKVTGKRFDNGKPLPEETMVVDLVLGKRPDFLNELSELAKVRCLLIPSALPLCHLSYPCSTSVRSFTPAVTSSK
jgi:hypothetical protein